MNAKRAARNRNPIPRTCRADLRPLAMFKEPLFLDVSFLGKPRRMSGTVARDSRADA